ncbi:MAG: Hsp20 family protein [Pseudomonadota bacterium]
MGNRLMRFEPFSDIARFDSLRGIEDFFHDFHLRPALRGFEMDTRIKIDVTETDQAYAVKAEIPGVKKEDIHVDIDRTQVTIRAESKRETEEKKGEIVVRSERYWGEQSRSFSLQHAVDEERAVANYKDGVLELTLPKKQTSSARKLVVS